MAGFIFSVLVMDDQTIILMPADIEKRINTVLIFVSVCAVSVAVKSVVYILKIYCCFTVTSLTFSSNLKYDTGTFEI